MLDVEEFERPKAHSSGAAEGDGGGGAFESSRDNSEELYDDAHPGATSPSAPNKSENITWSLHKTLAGGVKQTSLRRAKSVFIADLKDSSHLKQIVHSGYFEAWSAAIIIIYAATLALQMQHRGIEMGYELEIKGYTRRYADSVSFMNVLFLPVEWVFNVVFSAELVIRLFAEGREFVRSGWNIFDVFVATASWSEVLGADVVLHPMMIRVLRVLRLARLCKKLKHIQAFDSARVLVGSMEACVPVFAWTLVVLFFVQSFLAFLFVDSLAGYIDNESNPLALRQSVYLYFGTWSRALLTTSELTMGNWAPAMRLLTDNLHEAYGHCIIAYRMVVGFAMIRVIGGVFLHETFSVAASDDELMVLNKKRVQAKHTAKMKRFLLLADDGNDGSVSLEEFTQVLTAPEMRTWFAAQDLDVGDAELLFTLIDDDGDGDLTIDELTAGVARLKGTARSVHVHALLHTIVHLGKVVNEISTKVDTLIVGPTNQVKEDVSLSMKPTERIGPVHSATSVLLKKAPQQIPVEAHNLAQVNFVSNGAVDKGSGMTATTAMPTQSGDSNKEMDSNSKITREMVPREGSDLSLESKTTPL
eukprot:NODE_4298_length_1908_cov_8.839978.p1 GENE.NODE_4298_length_1908_cov_8.839978~~NODE_4298_length_1908_cov_8.839978.p1  ORF type:complete len:587 (+),score=126.73 NODE_4298_length_1908_cov_8.839978:1-1761(+)